MKSIKKFEDKKVKNMATIEGGRRFKSFSGNTDRTNRRGITITNSSWFRTSD